MTESKDETCAATLGAKLDGKGCPELVERRKEVNAERQRTCAENHDGQAATTGGLPRVILE